MKLYLLTSYCDISLQDITEHFVNDTLPGFSLFEYQWSTLLLELWISFVFNTCANLFWQVYVPITYLLLYGIVDVAKQL